MEKRRLLNFPPIIISESDFFPIILFIYSNGEWRPLCTKIKLIKQRRTTRERERKTKCFNSAIAYFILQERSYRAKWITVSNRKMAKKGEEKMKSCIIFRAPKGRKTHCWLRMEMGMGTEVRVGGWANDRMGKKWRKNEEKHWREANLNRLPEAIYIVPHLYCLQFDDIFFSQSFISISACVPACILLCVMVWMWEMCVCAPIFIPFGKITFVWKHIESFIQTFIQFFPLFHFFYFYILSLFPSFHFLFCHSLVRFFNFYPVYYFLHSLNKLVCTIAFNSLRFCHFPE